MEAASGSICERWRTDLTPLRTGPDGAAILAVQIFSPFRTTKVSANEAARSPAGGSRHCGGIRRKVAYRGRDRPAGGAAGANGDRAQAQPGTALLCGTNSVWPPAVHILLPCRRADVSTQGKRFRWSAARVIVAVAAADVRDQTTIDQLQEEPASDQILPGPRRARGANGRPGRCRRADDAAAFRHAGRRKSPFRGSVSPADCFMPL